jgi:hypothetical protein
MRITYINNDNGFNASSPPPSTNKTVVVFSPLGDKGAPGKSAFNTPPKMATQALNKNLQICY